MTDLEAWIQAGAGWAPVAVFVVTFLESLPGVSLLVPATALLLAVGVLLGHGTLELGPVLAAAVAGAVVGDAVGFWVCRAVGPRAVRRWLPRGQRRAYARALLLFRRWGWAAVFLGRFLGPARAVAPAIAGITRMCEYRFQAANIASALVWAPAVLLPGYAAARGAGHAAEFTSSPLLLGASALGTAGVTWLLLRHPALRRRGRRAAQGATAVR